MDKDAALIVQTLEGNMDAFEQLVSLYRKKLYSFLYKLTLSREDAEEILQEVFIKAYRYLNRYDSRYSFSSWIFKIAVNTYRTEARKRGKSKMGQIPEDLCSAEGYPEDIIERKEEVAELLRLIHDLKEEQRIVLLLKHIKGYTYREVGEILGISPEAAKMRIQRAREILGKRLEVRRRGALI